MISLLKSTIIAFSILLSFSVQGQDNYSRFEPGAIWKDTEGTPINAHGGGILVFDNTYYWFGEHKIAGKKGNTAQVGVRVYSSKDFYN